MLGTMGAVNPDLMKLRGLVDASIRRSPSGESHIIANHFQQVEDLLIGQGIDFVPEVDPLGERGPFIRRFVEQANLVQFVPDIIRKVMGTGEVLCWLRATPAGYRLRYYTAHEFKPYFSPDTDDLIGAVIVSQYSEDSGGEVPRVKWLKMVALREGTFIETLDTRPRVAGIGQNEAWEIGQAPPIDGDRPASGLGDSITFTPNPFKFLPLALLRNKPTGPGQRARDDFSEFASQLVSHDATMRAMGRNIRKYARQTVFTNLPRSKVMKGEATGRERQYGRSGVYASDYYDSYQQAERRGIMGGGVDDGEEIADIIGVDSEPGDDFLSVISWNPIQSDQLQYLQILEEKLHWAMGSVAQRGGGTAYEVRANLAWSEATANKKAHNILTRGLCLLIEMAIAHEEFMFEASNGTMGMTPAGDRTVKWRKVELVKPTAQEQLQTSILGRNLEEEGVGTPEILRLLFPDKTDNEIKGMTGGAGGVPFRKIEKTVPQLVQLYQTALALPPDVGVSLLPVADMMIGNLIEALNYGRQQPGSEPPNSTSLPSDSLGALIAAAAADGPLGAGGGPGAGPGTELVSADNQQSARTVPSSGGAIGNPLAEAFGKFTDPGRSPVLRALRRAFGG